jgi:hypothetical protein
MMSTRVSLALAGLGVTVERTDGTATDLLLTSGDDPHNPELFVPKRHFLDAQLPWIEHGDYVVFNIPQCDVSIDKMPSGAVKATRGLRKLVGGGKRQSKPAKLDDWRDVSWAVDFDHIEKGNRLNPDCLRPIPSVASVAARVHMTGGHLEAALPRHICLRSEQWELLNAFGAPVDLQVLADTMYHHWESRTGELKITVRPFGRLDSKTVSLVAVGSVIAGVRIQSTPLDHEHPHQDCGEGTMDHYGHLYSVLKNPAPGSARRVHVVSAISGFRIDETRRCGRAVLSE